jgi:hypothetical protein
MIQQNYKILVSDPWGYKNNEGKNEIRGKIIEINSNNFIIFKSNEILEFDEVKGNLFFLLPRYSGQLLLNHEIKDEIVNGGLLMISEYQGKNRKELENNSKFVLIGSIEKIDE